MSIKEIKDEFKRIQKSVESVTDDILDNTNVDELNENFKLLVEKIMKAKELLNSRDVSMVDKFLSKIPLIGNKIKEKIEIEIIDNSTLKDIADELREIQENIIQDTEYRFNYYREIYKVNEAAKKDIENQIKKLKKMKIKDEFEAQERDNLIRSLESLNVINANNLEECRLQIQSFSSMKAKTEEMSPQIQSMLRIQMVIATQNSKLKNIKQNYDLVKDVLNEFIVVNDRNTKESIKDAIELSQDNLIEVSTIKSLSEGRKNFRKELEVLVKELDNKKKALSNEIIEYTKTIEENPLLMFSDEKNKRPGLRYEKS